MEKIDYVVFAAALVSGIYWFAANAYGIFHEFNDLGYFAYGMWYLIHYPGVVHGLQSLVFANHIAPVQLLVLPFFYIDQSALTLLLAQDALLALTGLVVFYVSKDLLKNNIAALPQLLGNQSYYFKPEYVLVDFNSSISVNVGQNGQEQWFGQFMQDNYANYTILAENGTAVLYKET